MARERSLSRHPPSGSARRWPTENVFRSAPTNRTPLSNLTSVLIPSSSAAIMDFWSFTFGQSPTNGRAKSLSSLADSRMKEVVTSGGNTQSHK